MIEKNVETIVDWLDWLENAENVEDESWKKKVDPAVEKLKKESWRIVEKKVDRGRRQICAERICETILHPRR